MRWLLPLALVGCGAAAPGGVYCVAKPTVRVLAAAAQPDGSLKFGLSVWSARMHNISLFGAAARQGAAWVYTENMGAPTADARCRVTFKPVGRGFEVAADPNATCTSQGGYGTEIGTLTFPAASRESAVSHELDDPETFQRAGHCGSTSGG